MMLAPPPPAPRIPVHLLRAGQKVPAGYGFATVLPDIDFETYSEAGFVWSEALQKYQAPAGATKKGISAVGGARYLRDTSTEVLCATWDLKDGRGARRWRPGQPLPLELFQYLATFDPQAPASYDQRGLIEAHNSMFELQAILFVLHHRYGWPEIHPRQMRCSMAKARAWAMPGALANLGDVLGLEVKKDKAGGKLLDRLSIPRNPTKADPRRRIRPEDDPVSMDGLHDYNETDIVTEAGASARLPDLIPMELDYWLADQACNLRGIGVDVKAVHDCIAVLEQAHEKYNRELHAITYGNVARASEAQKLREWVYEVSGVYMAGLDEDQVEEALTKLPPHPPHPLPLNRARRALEIRQLIGSASVKKIYAMARMATGDARLCDLIIYHGARTGRDAHADVQPGNLPKQGPELRWCESEGCGRPYAKRSNCCPWCGTSDAFSAPVPPEDTKADPYAWHYLAVPHALEIFAYRDLGLVEYFFGDAVLLIAGCVRGLLVAGPGKDLIASDYSSIEAVVTAALAGEQWRLDAFERREDIYLHGAAGITGKTYRWYVENGFKKHPDRQKIGKPAELALGFGGWIGALRQFGWDGTDDEGRDIIVPWRAASPMVVELWGGQTRGKPWNPDKYEMYGLEGMAILAVQNPGEVFSYRGIEYQVLGDVLYCKLLSGRRLAYHSPRLEKEERFRGVTTLKLSYMTWNSNPKMGPMGWVRIETYGGKLAENVIQATARDVMAIAVPKLERAGYAVVLRVHDEVVAEVPEGFGSVEEFNAILCDLPDWAKGWPIRASGWRGKRYRKD